MSGWQDARNLLAVRMDNAGDVLMLGPALRAVRRASPGARITLLASPAGAKAAPLLPWIDDTIEWRAVWQDLGHLPFDPARELELVGRLRDRAFDGAIVFTSFSQSAHPPAYACLLAGVPLRAGHAAEFGGAVLTDWLRDLPTDLHQVERNLRLVESIGFPRAGDRLEAAIPFEARCEARRALGRAGIDPDRPYAVIHPGASAAARRYPAERWAGVASELIANGLAVAVTGVAKERESVERVTAGEPRARALAGDTGMAGFAAVLDGAQVVLCGNTLPLHLADVVGTPVVAAYSGTDLESQWMPRHVPNRLLRRDTPCAPCHRFACPVGLACLEIAPADLAGAALSLIGRPVPSRDARPERHAGADGTRATPEPRTIAVIQALGLGDLLCATPALRAMRRRWPQAEIALVGQPWAEELIGRIPAIDRVLPFPGWPGIAEGPADRRRMAVGLGELRAGRFDLAVQMHGSGEASNGFASSLDAGRAAGHARPDDRRLDLALDWIETEPEPLRWLRLAAALGAASTDARLELVPDAGDRAAAAALLAGLAGRRGPIVGIHPGAKDPARRWPAERFGDLARRLVHDHGAAVVLLGADADRGLAAGIARVAGPGALDLSGRTSLGELAAVIGTLDLLVTNDSGASHVAAAAGTRSVVLFGPADPRRWAPLDAARHRAIDAASLAPHLDRAAALAALPVGAVLDAATAQLAWQPEPAGREAATWPSA